MQYRIPSRLRLQLRRAALRAPPKRGGHLRSTFVSMVFRTVDNINVTWEYTCLLVVILEETVADCLIYIGGKPLVYSVLCFSFLS